MSVGIGGMSLGAMFGLGDSVASLEDAAGAEKSTDASGATDDAVRSSLLAVGVADVASVGATLSGAL